MRCTETMRILEIMRLNKQGLTQAEIATSVNCGRSTVGDILRKCQEVNLDYAAALAMTNEAIRARLYPRMSKSPIKDEPDWKEVHKWLGGSKRRNLQYAWEEYLTSNPDGLSYSQYCRRYAKWRESSGKMLTMVQEHEPGKVVYVDWAGDTLDCVVDPSTGELFTAHFFVAAMGLSHYPYVEAFPDETEPNWLAGHVHTFEHYGGVPKVATPDNCKTAITKPNYYDPKYNPSYWELAKHYGIAVIPARIKKPKDKSVVEGSIGWLETWLLEWLCGQIFYSFEELNRAIRMRLSELVVREFQKRSGSRESVFNELDKPALSPLPTTRFEVAGYIIRKVPDNYHVEYDKFYYSVPYALYKRNVTIRATSTMIEVINDDRERVALHQRRYMGRRYVTIPEHMPENHRRHLENSKRTGSDYLNWAATIGVSTQELINRMLKNQEVEMTAYRGCMGVLQFAKKYSPKLLEEACSKSLQTGSPCYATVMHYLKNPQQEIRVASPLPQHKNLRDPAEFA